MEGGINGDTENQPMVQNGVFNELFDNVRCIFPNT
jgi:hypothetical protein